MHNVSQADSALHYFSQDNYYAKDEGLAASIWYGKGAKQLKLIGRVTEKDLLNALNGHFATQSLGKWKQDPLTQQMQREHRPGFDITFSAPKSVSLLAEVAGITAVRQAHEIAVQQTLDYIEKACIQTRQMQSGKIETLVTGNLTAALFRHQTSRGLDPQTHTHAVIMNGTLGNDGRWRSITNEKLYTSQRLIGAVYNNALAHQLQKLGYRLETVDKHGNFEVKGFRREQLEAFSQRRNNIKDYLADKGIDISEADAKTREAATLKTRSRKVAVNHDHLKQTWIEKAQSLGIHFDAIEKHSVASIAIDINEVADQAMHFAIDHVFERESVVSMNKLLTTALEHGVGKTSLGAIDKAFKAQLKSGEIIQLALDKYTHKKLYQSERWTLEQVRQQKGKSAPVIDSDQIQQKLAFAQKQQGFDYTAGQKDALILALTTKDQSVAIQGLAGTGKTTMLKTLKEIAQDEGYTVRGMAVSSSAAKTLFIETGIVSNTVSMFQIKEQQLQSDIAFAQHYAPDFVRKPEIWVVDESSFLSQMQQVSIAKLAKAAQAKVIYLGDSLQLQAVASGKPFELMQQHGIKTALMQDINRQKTDTLKKAIDILIDKDSIQTQSLTIDDLNHTQCFEYLDQVGCVKEVPQDTIKALVDDLFKLEYQERRNTLVMTAFNQDKSAMNDLIRERMKNSGEIKQSTSHNRLVAKDWTQAMQREAQYYQAGDIIRFNRDYKRLGVEKGEYWQVTYIDATYNEVYLQHESVKTITWLPFKQTKVEVYDSKTAELGIGDTIRLTRSTDTIKNGEIAYVKAINGSEIELITATNKAGRIDLKNHLHWEHGYVVTVHEAQGLTSYRAFFHIPVSQQIHVKQTSNALGQRSFYVGLTRASHQLVIYTSDKKQAAQLINMKQDKVSVLETLEKQSIKIPIKADISR